MTVSNPPFPGPAAEQQSPLLRSGDAVDPGRVGRVPRVLLVGRDPECLRWLEAGLADAGFEAITRASEVASAVMALRRRTFGLLITAADLCGPDGGLLLVQWLRSRGPVHNRDLPAVLLTANRDRAWITRAADRGATLVLSYPLILKDFQLRMGQLTRVRQLAASAIRTDSGRLIQRADGE